MGRIIIIGMFLFFVGYIVNKLFDYLADKSFFGRDNDDDDNDEYERYKKNVDEDVWHSFKDIPHFTGKVITFAFIGKNKMIYTGQCKNAKQWYDMINKGESLTYWAYWEDIMPKT